jgi:hypothetical protein
MDNFVELERGNSQIRKKNTRERAGRNALRRKNEL